VDLDPITTEVLASAFLSITDEMSTVLIRTAYSPNIKERADCSTALFDAQGRILAQSQRLPLHMGSLLGSVRHIRDRFPLESLKPGDMLLANDPYHGGGSHLPDFNLIAPIFSGDHLIAFAANTAHHSDVGGMVPGSESADCREIYQEGLRLPPVRLCAEGAVQEDIMEIVKLNSRVPKDRDGDLRAQIAANRVATTRVVEVCERYGVAGLRAHGDALLRSTEQRIRSHFARMGDEEHVYEAALDPLPTGEEVLIRVRIRAVGDALEMDFTGTSPQMGWARNVPYYALAATAYCVVKSLLDPTIPSNDGFYRSLRVVAPEGCVVNPTAPAPVGARALTCGIVADAIVGALSSALPDRAVAESAPHQLITLAGSDPRDGGFFVNYETIAGALGAREAHDGHDGVRIYASGAANLPIEPLEQSFPFLIERYELIQESGGTGRTRGGKGIRRDYRILNEQTEVSLTGERHINAARGRLGGGDGAVGRFILNPGTPGEKELPRVARGILLKKGDVLRVETPGGAGFGPAFDGDSDPAAASAATIGAEKTAAENQQS
jgi:N-methylhydantoinase B